jgi:hypothetical protein
LKILIKYFYLFALLPAISPFPIGTDVQPLVFILSFFILLFYIFTNNLKLNKFDIFFFIFSSVSFLYPSENYNLTDRVGLFSGFLVFFVSKNNLDYLNNRLILFISFLNTFGITWHFINPSSFISFSSVFVRKIKITEIGFRGASGFSPEPGFAAAICIAIIVISIFLYKCKNISKIQFVFLLILNVISILLTKSALGIFYLVIIVFILSLSAIKFRNFLSIILIFIFIITFFDINQFTNSRNFDLVKKITENPQLIFNDASVSERLIGLDVGIRSLFLHPFGNGAGSYLDVANLISNKYNLESIYLNTRYGVSNSTSSLGLYFVEFGIFMLIWFFSILFYKFKFCSINIIIIIISSLFLMFSFSIAFPPTYIILSILHNKLAIKH